MSNPGELEGAFDAFEDPAAGSTSIPDRYEFVQASRNGTGGMPAWKRIEELREIRELNRHICDDIYGSKPVRSLWGE
jgi:hypothetical protein